MYIHFGRSFVMLKRRSFTMAQMALFLYLIFLHCSLAMANYTLVDPDVEEGKANARKIGIDREQHHKVVERYEKAVQNKEWWTNRSCLKGYPIDQLNCSVSNAHKCFGVEITYRHRVETDEQFPHWVEFLRHFPRCWRWVAPLVCLVHFRPCHLMGNPPDKRQQYLVVELFKAEFCNDMRMHCDFAFAHFPTNSPSYTNCEARTRGMESAQQQQQKNDTTIAVYNANCDLNSYTLFSRKEPGLLADQAKHCLTPLVYVNITDRTQQTHALPLVDECFIPCSSTIYDAHSLPTLGMFTLLCYFLVGQFALLLLLRGKLIFDFGMFIYFLAIVSSLLIALTFALSPFVGNGVVCLLGGKIRRFSGAFAQANGNDIWCLMEAAYLKLCLIFAFWVSFITVCNKFVTKSQCLPQMMAFCHMLISSFITFWHGEISIDPVSKVCHYFRFHSAWPVLVDFLSVLLVAALIVFLSKSKADDQKNGKKHWHLKRILIDDKVPQEAASIGCNDKNGVEIRGKELPWLQGFVNKLAHRITPLFLLIAYFGCMLSFYPLAENHESELLTDQMNCSLSALAKTGRWTQNTAQQLLKGCQTVPRVPHWYYANAVAVALDLILMLAVISASFSVPKSQNGGETKNGGGEEETEDEDRNEFQLLDNVNAATVAGSIGTQSSCGYAAIDSTASTNSALTGRRRRRLSNLQRGGVGRHSSKPPRSGREQQRLMAEQNKANTDEPMVVHATASSSCAESISALYDRVNQIYHSQQSPSSPAGIVTYPSFFCPPPQPLASTAAVSPTPLIVVHHWLHQYCPNGCLHCSQNCTHQQTDGNGLAEFATEKGDGKVEENEVGNVNSESRNEAEEPKAEESEYPGSEDDENEHDDSDSNDFCSDSPDSTEELFWNESCRKAAQSQQKYTKI